MLDPEKTRERVLLLHRLRELTAERMEQEIDETLKLLEEKNQATIKRLSRPKIP
jgi:hypothetical protein